MPIIFPSSGTESGSEVSSSLTYSGVWDASTNTPPLASSVGTANTYYIVSVGGTTELDGISSWSISDWVIFNGSTWEKLSGGASMTIGGEPGQVLFNDSGAIGGSSTFTFNKDTNSLSIGSVNASSDVQAYGGIKATGNDLHLWPDTGITALHNLTDPQTLHIYNTTDVGGESETEHTNYERSYMKWDTNVFKIGTEKGGTGTVREILFDASQLYFFIGGTPGWAIYSDKRLMPGADADRDIGSYNLRVKDIHEKGILYSWNTGDSTDFERAYLKWDSNVFKIGTEKGGTGTLRNLEIDGTVTFPGTLTVQGHSAFGTATVGASSIMKLAVSSVAQGTSPAYCCLNASLTETGDGTVSLLPTTIIASVSNTNPTSDGDYIRAISASASDSAGITATLTGLSAIASASGTSRDMLYGIQAQAYSSSTGNNQTLTALNTAINWQPTSTKTLTNSYGLSIGTPGVNANGTITNSYGLYIYTQTEARVTNGYNIYSVGLTSLNVFEGQIQQYNVLGSNFERAFLKWDTNVFKIGTEKGGSGNDRSIEIIAATAGAVTLQGIGINLTETYANTTVALWNAYLQPAVDGAVSLGSSGLAFGNITQRGTYYNYNTSDEVTNYERAFMKWDTNIFKIGTEKGGTGTLRNLLLSGGDGGQITLQPDDGAGYSNVSYTQIGVAGTLPSNGNKSATILSISAPIFGNEMSSLIGVQSILAMSNKVNTEVKSFVAGISFSGGTPVANFIGYYSKKPFVNISTPHVLTNADAIRISNFSSASNITYTNLPNVLTSYNTDDEVTNYERAYFKWDTNVFKIGTEAGGTGTARDINILPASGASFSTTAWTISLTAVAGGHLMLTDSMTIGFGVNVFNSTGSGLNLTTVSGQYNFANYTATDPADPIYIWNTKSGIAGVNYERAFMKWDSNVFKIGTEKGGTGTSRGIKIQGDNTSAYLDIDSGGNVTLTNYLGQSLQFSGGHGYISTGRLDITGSTTNTYLNENGMQIMGINASTPAGPVTIFNLGDSYAAANFERVNLKWDSNVLKLETEKGGSGIVRNTQIQADTLYSHNSQPYATSHTITAFADYGATVAGTVLVTSATHNLPAGTSAVTISGTTHYNGSFTATKVGADTFYITVTWVSDDAAGTMKTSNDFERAFLKWDTNVFKIGTEKGGSGTNRDIVLTSGTGLVGINLSPTSVSSGASLMVNHVGTSLAALTIGDNATPTNETGIYLRSTTKSYIKSASGSALYIVTATNDDTKGITIGTAGELFKYNSDDFAGNYERGYMKWDSNVFKVGTEKGGSGTLRPMVGNFFQPIHPIGSAGAAQTIDPLNGLTQTLTLSEACTIGFTQPASGTARLVLVITQATGSHYNTTFTGAKWPNGAPPVITATDGAIDVISVLLEGSNIWAVANQDLR